MNALYGIEHFIWSTGHWWNVPATAYTGELHIKHLSLYVCSSVCLSSYGRITMLTGTNWTLTSFTCFKICIMVGELITKIQMIFLNMPPLWLSWNACSLVKVSHGQCCDVLVASISCWDSHVSLAVINCESRWLKLLIMCHNIKGQQSLTLYNGGVIRQVENASMVLLNCHGFDMLTCYCVHVCYWAVFVRDAFHSNKNSSCNAPGWQYH